jgi:uncharacterized protein
VHLTLHLTSRCNLRCSYCYVGKSNQSDMSVNTMRRAIEFAANERKAHGDSEGVGVVFFGGEPLLQRELIRETVRYCRDLETQGMPRFHFKVTTNGTLLDDAFFTDPDTGDVFAAISHDGIREAHDAHRVDIEGLGTFDCLAPKLRVALRHRPNTPVMMVVTPSTVQHYADSVQWLYAQGFRYILVTIEVGATWSERTLDELARQYRQLAKWYYEATRREEKFFFSPFEVKIASHINPGGCWKERCELGRRQLSVGTDGRLYPCVQFVGDRDWCIGHVNEGVDATKRRELDRIRVEEEEACRSCAIRSRCNHHCGCANLRSTGRMDRVAPAQCAHERIVLPVADELASKLYRVRDAMFIQKHYNAFYPLVSAVEDFS